MRSRKTRKTPSDMALYYLSFLPLLLLTLTVHELGHLLAARLLHVKTAAFQIGVGRRIASFHTGRTPIAINESTLTLGPKGRTPGAGEKAWVYVVQDPSGTYTATAVMPETRPGKLEQEHREAVRTQNEQHIQLRGRVIERSGDRIVLADMAWSLHVLPFMAGVHLPEDPGLRAKNIYNTVSWPRQMLIVLAGPLANMVLMAATLLTLAIFPITAANVPILTVTSVAPNSTADAGGLEKGDRVVQAGPTLMPSKEKLQAMILRAGQHGRPLDLRVMRGQDSIGMTIGPDPLTGRIGATLSENLTRPVTRPKGPREVRDRFTHLSGAYFSSITSLLAGLGADREGPPEATGILLGAHQTAQAVEFAGLRAWLAVMGAFTMSIALLNLLPVPPLDGYRLVTQTIQALRHGKPISQRVDQAMTLGGLIAIYSAGLYLVLIDITYLLQ